MTTTTKRLAAVMLAMATFAASAVIASEPAKAADAAQTSFPTAEITVHGAERGATFEAYRLLNSTDNGNEAYSYTLRTDRDSSTSTIQVTDADRAVTSALETATGKHDASSVYKLFADNGANNDNMKTLMQKIYRQLQSNKVSADTTASATGKDADTQNAGAYQAVFSDVPQGYYLIAQTSAATTAGSTVSLLIANTANSTNDKEGRPGTDVTVKTDTVILTSATDKQSAAAQYQDDYAIGADFTWHANGTLPSNYALYDTYAYQFTVTLPAGVTADSYTNGCPEVTISAINGDDVTAISPSSYTCTDNNGSYTYAFKDLKTAKAADDSGTLTITASSSIRLDMKAKLNDNANLGKAGNTITATVSYANDSLDSTKTGTTAESTATLYTHTLTVNNTDNSDKALNNGAKYTLYSCDDGYEKCNQFGAETPASGDIAAAVFNGLGSGAYELRETTVPAGYTGVTPIRFKVTSTFANGTVTLSSDNPAVTVNDDASLAINVKNTTSGGLLPSTGGVGVIVMYVCGALLVGGSLAGIIVAARRRNRE